MPLVSQTFDQLLDFTRTSAATFVGSNGLIQNTPASVNLLTWTQQFDNAAWTKTAATVTANTTVAPDGTSTADTVAETATTASPWIRQQPNVTSGATYTGSVYVKKGGGSASRDFIQLVYNTVAFGANAYANFNIASGTVTATGAGVTASISDAGNGWYRCSITGTAISTGSGQFFIAAITSGSSAALSSYLGDVNATTFLWGAQLEAASAATTYTRNNGGVFPPRFDYDPVTLAAKGLLIEEQRTNLLVYSADFTNALWVATASAKTSTNNLDPAGTSTALLITANGASTAHYLSGGTGISYTSGTTYTASAYVKAGSTSFAQITLPTSTFGAGQYANFELTGSGSVTASAGGTASIVPAGDGWYRITFSAAATATASTAGFFLVFIANGTAGRLSVNTSTDTLYIWGAQLEAGAFATSYIPTVASQVTRTADQCSIVAPNFAPWYNAAEGSFVVEADVYAAVAAGILTASDGTVNNYLMLDTTGAGNPRYRVFAAAVSQAAISVSTVTPNTAFKVAFCYASNSFNLAYNGLLGTQDTSGTVPTVNRLLIAATTGGGALNGHIRSIRYYPTRLSDAQLQALTA